MKNSNKRKRLSQRRKRLIHSSFRVEESVLLALQSEADKQDTTLSKLVNRTLKDYVTSDMYFKKIGFIPVSRIS